MRLFEYEAKEILSKYGIKVPKNFGLISHLDNVEYDFKYPVVGKVQILQGKRGKQGGVEVLNSENDLRNFLHENLDKKFGSCSPTGILIEEFLPKENKDFFISILYDPELRSPVFYLKEEGGVNVENMGGELYSSSFDLLDDWFEKNKEIDRGIKPVISSALECFQNEDCKTMEINPLRLHGGEYVALDIKMELDDRAFFRHDERNFEERSSITDRELTQREKKIIEINKNPEYKGTPIKYIELEGDVAVLLSGGGASLAIFDQLIESGIKPGNYSEYSGNPKKEKVEELTKVILGKPNQKGLLVAGAVANFTMIDETMAGIASVLKEMRPKYPIVIRRDGPNADTAKQMMMDLAKDYDFDITWFGGETALGEATEFFIKKIKEEQV